MDATRPIRVLLEIVDSSGFRDFMPLARRLWCPQRDFLAVGE